MFLFAYCSLCLFFFCVCVGRLHGRRLTTTVMYIHVETNHRKQREPREPKREKKRLGQATTSSLAFKLTQTCMIRSMRHMVQTVLFMSEKKKNEAAPPTMCVF